MLTHPSRTVRDWIPQSSPLSSSSNEPYRTNTLRRRNENGPPFLGLLKAVNKDMRCGDALWTIGTPKLSRWEAGRDLYVFNTVLRPSPAAPTSPAQQDSSDLSTIDKA